MLNTTLHASAVKKLNFKSRSSSLVLVKGQNSILKIQNKDKVKAWADESIVRYEGPSTGLSIFTNGGIYGYGSVVGIQDPQIQLLTASSNAIKYLDLEMRTQSNWITTLGPAQQAAVIRENSNAFMYFANNTFGPQNLTISGNTTLPYDIFLHPNHKLIISANCTLGADGKTIHIARNQTLGNQSVIEVANDATLTFSNVTIDNMDDSAFYLGTNASVRFGDNTTLALQNNVSMTRDWIFTGSGTVDGNGKDIILYDGTASHMIEVQNRKSLVVRNANLFPMKDQNLRCGDDFASIGLQNSWLALDQAHPYQFGMGQLEIWDDVKITGTGGTFGYTSRQPLYIYGASMLTLDSDITFSYAPKFNNRDLIEMEDMSSVLHAKSCTLISTNTGMRLTKGTLLLDGKVTFSNSAPTHDVRALSEGLSFGNGTLANDLNVEMMPGASIDIQKGILLYDNVGV